MPRPRKLVSVVWADAHSAVDELNMDEIRGRHRPNVIHTMGYVLISDAIGVMMAGEWLPPEGGGDETFRNVTFIPRANVMSEGVVKRVKKTKTGTVDSTVRSDTQEAEGPLRDVPSKTNG